MKNPISLLRRQLEPSRREKLQKALSITAGTAAAIWVVLRLKRDLYGPGGSRMSRYDSDVDDVWEKEK